MPRSSFARGEHWDTERLSHAPQITLPGRQPGSLVLLTAVPEPAHLLELERETSPMEGKADVENNRLSLKNSEPRLELCLKLELPLAFFSCVS